MARLAPKYIIGIMVSLLLVGVLLPIGLSDIIDYNGTYFNASNASQTLGVNATIGTLVGTIVPIMGVIGLALMFISSRND